MTRSRRAPDEFQRNARAPGLLVAPFLVGGPWFSIVLYVVTIFSLIVAWFAVQASQWWWLAAFIPIAVLWNPAYPLPFSGPIRLAAQILAAGIFLTAGLLIKTKRKTHE